MARLTATQKAIRTLKLLLGLRNPIVAAALQEHGFTERDLDEGWRRLAGLTQGRLGQHGAVRGPTNLQQLDIFENKWFPVARLTLERHYPQLEEALFLNLSQQRGMEVVLSVASFLERFALLAEGKPPYGSEGPAAAALLATRGLTPELLASVRALLADLSAVPDGPSPVAENQAAEEELWSWYLEWGGIARHVITDRRALRAMGFLARSRGSSDEAEEDDGGEEEGDGANRS